MSIKTSWATRSVCCWDSFHTTNMFSSFFQITSWEIHFNWGKFDIQRIPRNVRGKVRCNTGKKDLDIFCLWLDSYSQYMPILHMVPVLLPLIHISLTGRFVNDNQEEEENQNVNELWIMTLLHMSMRHLWWCKCLAVMAVAVDYDDFDIDDRASRDNVFEVSTRWWQWRLSDTQHSLTSWTRCL